MKTFNEQLQNMEENEEWLSNITTILEGNYTIHLESRDIVSFNTKQEIIEISKGDKIGLMTRDCKIIVPPIYDGIRSYSIENKTIIFEKIIGHKQFEKKVGVATFSGEILLEAKYDEITYMDDKRYIVRSNYQYAILDYKGNLITDFGKYDFIDGFVKGVARVKKDKKWGLIDEKGFRVVNTIFDEIWKLRSDLSTTRAIYQGENFYIHIWNPKDPERMYTNPIHFYKDVCYCKNEYPELNLNYREEFSPKQNYNDSDPLNAFEGDEELYNDWLLN